jgi:hypothetical protein
MKGASNLPECARRRREAIGLDELGDPGRFRIGTPHTKRQRVANAGSNLIPFQPVEN